MKSFFDRPVLAIESSCDETSAAVVVGREVRSNVVASQIAMHATWGGVVPEAAARAHVEAILPVISEAFNDAGVTREQIGAIAVTNRPGLVGALSVGVTAAKGLAFALKIPLLGVHHIEGHLSSLLAEPLTPIYPLVVFVVSGGHTELVLMETPLRYRILGATRDDAAGEALDKSARLLGLGYPGGRALEELARAGDPKAYPLPRALGTKTFEMSFSGLKTAVLRTVEREGETLRREDLAASAQSAVVDVLVARMARALDLFPARGIGVVGGVASNTALREGLAALAAKRGVAFLVPDRSLCTDNAGMIGLAGSLRLAQDESDGLDLEPIASAELPGLVEEGWRSDPSSDASAPISLSPS
ncbi:tRNA (adenosine(37)-N6)-threonylcarbamoyltransferase complex transferase subunit TsaD [bacterium]|nr:MAG: tRNA (adenosine(37)-N6)-threonylcarbamoyltransferase complex transferase subunit TsaD [bacterium]